MTRNEVGVVGWESYSRRVMFSAAFQDSLRRRDWSQLSQAIAFLYKGTTRGDIRLDSFRWSTLRTRHFQRDNKQSVRDREYSSVVEALRLSEYMQAFIKIE